MKKNHVVHGDDDVDEGCIPSLIHRFLNLKRYHKDISGERSKKSNRYNREKGRRKKSKREGEKY